MERALSGLALLQLPLPYVTGFVAAQAFLSLRSRDGAKRAPYSDFYIGARAQTENLHLLTRDAARYRIFFPYVRLITPK